MTSNPSVKQFRTDMTKLANQAGKNFHQVILGMADELVGNIQSAIQHSESGHLRASVRKKDVSRDGKVSVLVMAGGPLTTRPEKSGNADYALFEEFGTVKEDPRPFFYNTVRLYQKNGIEQYRETLEQTIAENNLVRANRSNNFNDAAFAVGKRPVVTTVSASQRGAVVIQKR